MRTPRKKTPTISLILPLYKQVDQIKFLYKKYLAVSKQLPVSSELLFVVNGPDDGTYETLEKISKKTRSVRVLLSPNAGWGEAVQFGFKQARGKYLCYTNTARTDPANLVMIIKLALQHKQVVVKATRMMRQNILRKIGSTLYNFEARILFNTPVWDVNATPKIIPRSVYKKIHLSSRNDLIDAELVADCFAQHIPILEVPILLDHRHSGKSTTNILSGIKMYMGLYKLRKYDKKHARRVAKAA